MEEKPAATPTCPNCGFAASGGRFCTACGQDNARLRPRVVDWLSDAANALTNLSWAILEFHRGDGRFVVVRTLLALGGVVLLSGVSTRAVYETLLRLV